MLNTVCYNKNNTQNTYFIGWPGATKLVKSLSNAKWRKNDYENNDKMPVCSMNIWFWVHKWLGLQKIAFPLGPGVMECVQNQNPSGENAFLRTEHADMALKVLGLRFSLSHWQVWLPKSHVKCQISWNQKNSFITINLDTGMADGNAAFFFPEEGCIWHFQAHSPLQQLK